MAGADGREDDTLRQGGSTVCQPAPVKDIRFLADGITEEWSGPRPPDGPDHWFPVRCSRDQNGALRPGSQGPGRKARQETEIPHSTQGTHRLWSALGHNLPHVPLKAGPNHGFIPAVKQMDVSVIHSPSLQI